MSVIRQIILLTALFCCHAAIAGENCNMNGDWYTLPGPQTVLHIKQTDASIEGKLDGSVGACTMLVSGLVANNDVTYEMYMSGEGCTGYRMEVKGSFNDNCSWIMGSFRIVGEGNITGPVMLHRVPINIVSPDTPNLIITAEPRMPEITFKAKLLTQMNVNQFIPPFTWKMDFMEKAAGIVLHVRTDEVMTMENSFTPDFHNMIDVNEEKHSERHIETDVMGGELTVKVNYYQNLQGEKKYKFKGTNPGQIEIEKMITDPTLRKIACAESRYKQFRADREGGVGFPEIGGGGVSGGAGIMQLYSPKPTPEQVWNWRENIKAGMSLYKEKRRQALALPKIELKEVNKKRKLLGLALCKSLPALDAEQLEKETVRRYNCGAEYKWEPWDAPDCDGKWVSDPYCKTRYPDKYDANYLNNVFNCDINK